MATPILLTGIPALDRALDRQVRGFERRPNLHVVQPNIPRRKPAEPVVPMDFPKPVWDPRDHYDRVGTVPLLDLVDAMALGFGGRVTVLGQEVNCKSTRIEMFLYHALITGSVECCRCGLVASHWAVEKAKNDKAARPHLNLYGFDPFGHERQFTQDHIEPKSQGGPDACWNMRRMCRECNIARDVDPELVP